MLVSRVTNPMRAWTLIDHRPLRGRVLVTCLISSDSALGTVTKCRLAGALPLDRIRTGAVNVNIYKNYFFLEATSVASIWSMSHKLTMSSMLSSGR